MSFFDYPDEPRSDTGDHIRILETATEAEWQSLLAHAEPRVFSAGEDLVRIGDRDTSFYILSDGIVHVVVPGRLGRDRVIGVRGEGAVFGEVAFFDDRPRTATIRAATDGRVLRFTRKSFEAFAAWEPVVARQLLFDLSRSLALRLRQTMTQLYD